jgi:hypothetical protein
LNESFSFGNSEIAKGLNITTILENIQEYEYSRDFWQHINRMPLNRLL